MHMTLTYARMLTVAAEYAAVTDQLDSNYGRDLSDDLVHRWEVAGPCHTEALSGVH